MKYKLFLFDLDDTLLDFKKSEELSFQLTLESFGIKDSNRVLFNDYQVINKNLWKLFEENKTTKDFLKIERFRKTFAQNGIELNPEIASKRYLEALPTTVVLIDYAEELCKILSQRGEIGIITNGIHHVQTQRIQNSSLAPYISFVSVSEMCGYAKPDARFFDFTTKLAKDFSKEKTIIIGDRLDADILGAKNFGIDSCWFNPLGAEHTEDISPNYNIRSLKEFSEF